MRDFLDRLLAVDETPKLTLQIPATTDRAARELRIRHQLEAAQARLATADPARRTLDRQETTHRAR